MTFDIHPWAEQDGSAVGAAFPTERRTDLL